MDLVAKAKDIINSSLYLSLSTTFKDSPWSTPLWYSVDKDYTFYFISDKNSLHCKNINNNPKVAFCIFNSTSIPDEVFGLQIYAVCKKIEAKEIPWALKCIFAKAGSQTFKEYINNWALPSTYTKLSSYRIYKITPTKIYINDPEADDAPRIKININ